MEKFTFNELRQISKAIDKMKVDKGKEVETFVYNYGIKICVVNKHYSKIKDGETHKTYFEFLFKNNGDLKYPTPMTKEQIEWFKIITDKISDVVANM